MTCTTPLLVRGALAALVVVGVLIPGPWRVGPDASQPPGWPVAPAERIAAPVPPVAPAGGTTGYLRAEAGEPVAYDPCTPVHVVVNDRTAPPGADVVLAEALAEVSAATGLTFVVDGTTSRKAVPTRSPHEGERWAPVLVAWSDPAESPGLAGDVAGRAGSVAAARDGRTWWVTGTVVLDGPQIGPLLAGPAGPVVVRGLVMHELGHLVGLAHVDDPAELMHPAGRGTAHGWGPGDRAGLARLGATPCASP